MRRWAVLLVALLLAACATLPPAQPEHLFSDASFAAPAERLRAEDVFAVSPAMKHYLATEVAAGLASKSPQQALFDALYTKGQLQLEYESEMTRNAAQAFAARSGNCLSLVIMTAAFAKEMDLAVTYQMVDVDDTWGHVGDLYLAIGHVNLTLGTRPVNVLGSGRFERDLWTIDFLPPADLRSVRSHVISERTVVAMYFNNRAVEALAAGDLDDAYWRAREALAHDPGFVAAYNTLGAVYRQSGDLPAAERALTYALRRDPANTQIMSNLVAVLKDLGRGAEAADLARKLAALEPEPPFVFFRRGVAAMRNGDYRTAKEMFTKEIARAPYFHEFHFWLGAAYAGLGEFELAREEMTIALDRSTRASDRALYASKLDRINALRVR